MNILKTRKLSHPIITFAATVFLGTIAVTMPSSASSLNGIAARSNYYYGVFEDGQLQYNDQIFTDTINDLKNHHLNAILFSNTQPNLTISDNLHFNVVAAPMTTLYESWYPTSVPLSLSLARTLIYPIADSLKNHPSLVAYNIRDDSTPDYADKIAMARQVFNERDPNHPAIPLLITGALAQEVYTYTQPSIYMAYQFPFKTNTTACQVFNGAKDWIYAQRESFQVRPQNTPIWFVLQAHKTIMSTADVDTNSNSILRQPSPAELSLQYWEALGEEAKGLYWYIYSTSPFGQGWVGLKDLPSQYAMVSSLGQTFTTIQPYLAQSEKIPDRFKVSGSNYISTLKDLTQSNRYYIIAVNQSCSSQNITISSDYFNGSVKDLLTGETYKLGSSVPFTGGQGRMFQVVNTNFKPRPATQANIVQNPSFETSSQGLPAAWNSTDQIQIDTTVRHSGSASLKIGPGGSLASQSVNLAPNTYYYFSYWIKTQSLNENMVGMRVVQTAPSTVYLTSLNWDQSGSSNWVKRVGFFRTSASASTNRVDIVWGLSSGQTFWVDDVTLCRMDQPCPDEYLSERLVTPGAPTGLQGAAVSQRQINLTWNSPSSLQTTPTNYHIYRGGRYIGSVSGTTMSFTDTSAAACAVNNYTVRTYLDGVESRDSSVAAIKSMCDPIMSDGFESGSFKAWTSNITDSGSLRVAATSALVGNYGMRASINDTHSIYVIDETPSDEKHYRARFYFDPNSLTMTQSDNFFIFYGYQGTTTPIVKMQFQRPGSYYQVRIGTISDGGTWFYTPYVSFSNAPHLLEFDWEAATDSQSSNGSLTLWVDQVQQSPVTGLDNDGRRIDQIRLGAVTGVDSGTSGTIFFDAFVSKRFSYIGPDASAASLMSAMALSLDATEEATVEATLEVTEEATMEVTNEATTEATDEATETATLEMTADLTTEPTTTVEASLEPTEKTTDGLQVIHADDPAVLQTGNWLKTNIGGQRGGVLVSHSSDTALTLTFIGTHLNVDYIGGARFGSFNIEVDDVVVRTVDGATVKPITMMRTSLDISEGQHTLRILPASGVTAIRTFSINGAVVSATAEPTSTQETLPILTAEATGLIPETTETLTTDEAAQPPLATSSNADNETATATAVITTPASTEIITPETTESLVATEALTSEITTAPQSTEIGSPEATLPSAYTDVPLPPSTTVAETPETPTPEVTLPPAYTDVVIDQPILTPITATATFAPFVLPLYQSMDDNAPLWTATAGWSLSQEGAYNGSGASWRALSSGQSEALKLQAPIDLGAAQFPHLSFETRLVGAAQAQVQVSLDGAAWETVSVIPPSDDWTLAQVDLPRYRGAVIYVQFVLNTLAPSQGQPTSTWQIDNLTVSDLPPTVPPLVTLTASETALSTVIVTPTIETPATPTLIEPASPTFELSTEEITAVPTLSSITLTPTGMISPSATTFEPTAAVPSNLPVIPPTLTSTLLPTPTLLPTQEVTQVVN